MYKVVNCEMTTLRWDEAVSVHFMYTIETVLFKLESYKFKM